MTLETLEKIYTDWLRDGKRLVDSLNGLGLAVGGGIWKTSADNRSWNKDIKVDDKIHTSIVFRQAGTKADR